MADFNIRSESVDVEQIMKQIRARIQEKRGVDYTEDQIRELATVRLEKFLDPKNLRSDLLEQFRRSRPALPEPPKEPPPVEPPYTFDDQTLVASHRGSLRFIRNMLRPILKLFFNPNTLNQVLHTQAEFNVDMIKRDLRRRVEMQMFDRSRAEWNILYYEVLHNLVLETTRNAIELKNMKMTLEALASRLDFSERRVRALEGVVQYRPEAVRPRPSPGRPLDKVGVAPSKAEGREVQGRPDAGRATARSGRPEPVEGRDRDRSRDRAGQHEIGPVAGETDSPASDLASGAEAPVPGAAPGGAIGATDVGTRRRRRRRRGRRGTGMVPAAAPVTDETNGTVENDIAANDLDAAGGDTSAASDEQPFDEGDDLEETKPDVPSNEALEQPRDAESNPRRDPDQQ